MNFSKFAADGTLRPMFVVNIVLVVVILGAFGIAHTWVGMRQRDKAKEVNRLQESIQRIQNEISKLKKDVGQREDNGALMNQIQALGVKLECVKPGVDEVITLELNNPEVAQTKAP